MHEITSGATVSLKLKPDRRAVTKLLGFIACGQMVFGRCPILWGLADDKYKAMDGLVSAH